MTKYALAVMAVSLACALLVIYLIKAPERAAAADLEAVNGITVGQTTEADLLRRPAFEKLERNCYQAECLYFMLAENNLLGRLHLAPRASFAAMVWVRDGMVIKVAVNTWTFGRPGLSLAQVMELPGCNSSPCVKDLIPPNKVLAGTVVMINSQSDIRNRLPAALNSQCLSRLHGCKTNLEWMPVLKEVGGDVSMR